MIISPANINLFFTTLGSRFWAAFGTTLPWWQRIAQPYPVDSESWADAWIGMIDTYREWLGSRTVHTPGPETYLVPMQLFELTEGVDELKIKDDKYGIYFPLADFMGQQAKKWPDYQLRDLMMNKKSQVGARQKGTDGLTHWNTAHPIDVWDSSKGTFCNDFRGGVSVGGVTVGGTFTTNAFNSLWQEFSSRKSQSGEAMGVVPDLSMGPPQLKAAMTTVLQSAFYAPPMMGGLGAQAVGTGAANAPFVGAMDNPLRGWTDLMINEDFASEADEWYMFFTKGPIKPMSWLLREAPDFVARMRPDDPVVFDTHTYLFGSKARGAPAWGIPQLSAISGT
jgi:phage major head subunit gpT-like protein